VEKWTRTRCLPLSSISGIDPNGMQPVSLVHLADRAMNITESARQITAENLVQEVVDRHPETITVFSHHGMNCVGCYVSPFHTIADCAREHSMQIELLLGDLNRAIANAVCE
jgi:hybrid cluster-associated redox disulfide protein